MARITILVTCQTCGKTFEKEPRKFNAGQKLHFCSKQCYKQYRQTFWKPSEKQVKAFEKANKKRHSDKIIRDESKMECLVCDYCGKHFRRIQKWGHRKNGTFCSQICANLGQERWGRFRNNGKRSRQSITNIIKRRFIDVCSICGWNESYNDCHHIISVLDGGKNTIGNIILLCPNHHRMVHIGKISGNDLKIAQLNMQRMPGVPDRAFSDIDWRNT